MVEVHWFKIQADIFDNEKIKKLLNSLELPKKYKDFRLDKYGRLRLNYLKENKHIQYEIMKCEDTLIDHLKEVQELANKRYNQLMEEFKKKKTLLKK